MIKELIKKYPLQSFFILTYFISWSFWSLSLFFNVKSPIFMIVGSFSPMISSIFVTLITKGILKTKKWFKRSFNIKLAKREYLLALLLPLIVGGIGITLFTFSQGIERIEIDAKFWEYPIYLIVVAIIGGGQEELGWRGFALPNLLKKYNPLIASIIIGLIWTFWHLPLFFSSDTIQYGIPFVLYTINTVSISVLLTGVYLRTKSILPVILLHAGLNAIGNYSPTDIPMIYPYIVVGTVLVSTFYVIKSWKKIYKPIHTSKP